ncbi:MAG TPA: CPBP family intramembrane glutamic endopeptidase [Gemmatimonadaceae bacterium]|nr:CPBP family intramembrane glutamic endopeptidase [Gemmatimonadaceae bacterium]
MDRVHATGSGTGRVDEVDLTPRLLVFFAITFAASWLCWIAFLAISGGTPASNPAVAVAATAIFLLGVFAPGLTAIALTARNEGRAAVEALLGRILKWDVGARWYVFAIGYIPVIKLLAAAVHRVATGQWPRFGQEPLYLMLAAILISTWVQAGEEIGWRGYALPRLSEHFGLPISSITLGIIWATWHLPLFFFPESSTLGQSFPLYLLQVTAISVTMAWLYWRTGGSLLLVMLFHAAANNLKDIVPSTAPAAAGIFAFSGSLVGWLTVTFLWIGAAFFLIQMSGTASLRSLSK